MGKSLAEFRKASDDFKRTWEREVALETTRLDSAENSILNNEGESTYAEAESVAQPVLEPANSDLVVPRQNPYQPATVDVTDETHGNNPIHEPLRKQDWL